MFRLAFLLLLCLSAEAGQISAFVNCDGNTSSVVSQIPLGFVWPLLDPPLMCTQNGVVARASVPYDIMMEAVAVPCPVNICEPIGDGPRPVEARVQMTGNFTIMNVSQPFVPASFWAACFMLSTAGSEWSVSGNFGPGSFGSPCDFAHSAPLLSDMPTPYAVDLTLFARNDSVVTVSVQPVFFDAAGGPVFVNGFGFGRLADVPEPTMAFPAGLICAAIALVARRSRPWVRRHSTRRFTRCRDCEFSCFSR